jgi:hypothetical protein
LTAGELEYLVLADSVLVVHGDAGTTAITDDREATFADRYRPGLDVLGGGGEARWRDKDIR